MPAVNDGIIAQRTLGLCTTSIHRPEVTSSSFQAMQQTRTALKNVRAFNLVIEKCKSEANLEKRLVALSHVSMQNAVFIDASFAHNVYCTSQLRFQVCLAEVKDYGNIV